MTIIKAEYKTHTHKLGTMTSLTLLVKTSEGYFYHFTLRTTAKEAFARCWASIRFQTNCKKQFGTRIFS